VSLLLQVSDTHFGTEQPEVLAALSVLIEAQRPDVLVLSGDITQRATTAEFALARRWLDTLPTQPRLLLPGNHDIPLFNLALRLLQPYARYRKGLQQASLEGELVVGPFHLFGVRTTRRRRHIDGEISAAQTRQLVRRLAASDASRLRVVVTHQPLAVDRPQDAENVCHGALAALPQLVAAGADLFLAGHIHWPFAIPLTQRPTAWAVNAGTAVSRRVRDGVPNSCNLIRYAGAAAGERVAQLQRWDCPLDGGGFRQVSSQTLTLA